MRTVRPSWLGCLLSVVCAACQISAAEATGERPSPSTQRAEKDTSTARGDGDGDGEASSSSPTRAVTELPELDAKVAELLAATPTVPGATVAIVKNGHVAYAKGYGKARLAPPVPMTADTIVNVASISKIATAVSVMRLVEEGKVGLDASLSPILGFTLENPSFPGVPITLRMLLAHTSSIDSRSDSMEAPIEAGWVDGQDSPMSLKTLVEDTFTPGRRWYSRQNFHPARPGTKFDYCNICPAITARVVEKVSGQEFAAFSQAQVFTPLAMTSTTWRLAETDTSRLAVGYSIFGDSATPLTTPEPVPHAGAPYYPATTLRTTASDLGRLLIEFTTTHALLKAETAKEMLREQYPSAADGKGQGLGWYSIDEGVWGHSGSYSGHSADMLLRIADGVGVIVLLNGDGGDEANPPLTSKIEDALWAASASL